MLPQVHLLLLARRLKYLILVLNHGIWGSISFNGASPDDTRALIRDSLLLRQLLLLVERGSVVGLPVHGLIV